MRPMMMTDIDYWYAWPLLNDLHSCDYIQWRHCLTVITTDAFYTLFIVNYDRWSRYSTILLCDVTVVHCCYNFNCCCLRYHLMYFRWLLLIHCYQYDVNYCSDVDKWWYLIYWNINYTLFMETIVQAINLISCDDVTHLLLWCHWWWCTFIVDIWC